MNWSTVVCTRSVKKWMHFHTTGIVVVWKWKLKFLKSWKCKYSEQVANNKHSFLMPADAYICLLLLLLLFCCCFFCFFNHTRKQFGCICEGLRIGMSWRLHNFHPFSGLFHHHATRFKHYKREIDWLRVQGCWTKNGGKLTFRQYKLYKLTFRQYKLYNLVIWTEFVFDVRFLDAICILSWSQEKLHCLYLSFWT